MRFLVEKGFTNTATVIERSKVNSPASHVDVSNKRKVYTLCSGETKWKAKILFHQPGFARKIRWSSRTRYTEKQIDFLRWAFGLGLKNINQKLTAEKAAALMKVVGTEEGAKLYPKDKYMAKAKDGKPLFSRSELIEKYEIKSFFSRAKGDNVKKAGKDSC